jgi:O-antigen/teichoic acid export membrane protein
MNKKTPSIKINFIYTLSYQILALIVPLITTPYVSRIFSPDSIGMISYTTSYSNYFLLIGNLGIATYAQIEIARNREDRAQTSRLFFEILIARTTTMLLSLLLYIGFTAAAAPQYRPLYWILIANIVGSMLDCSWFFQGLEQFKRVTLRNFIIKILSTIMIFVFIKKPSDLYLYVLFLYGSTIAANLYLWLGISKEVGRVDFRQLKFTRHYKGCFLYFLPTIASTLNTSMGKTLLGILGRSDAENGYFEQAYKIFNVIIVLPASLNVVMRPRMAYLVSNQKKDEVESKLYYSMSFIMFLMIAIGFGLIGTADNLVPWFFGPGWDKVSFLLKLFSLCIVLYSITLCFSEQYFLPYGKIKTLTKIICRRRHAGGSFADQSVYSGFSFRIFAADGGRIRQLCRGFDYFKGRVPVGCGRANEKICKKGFRKD